MAIEAPAGPRHGGRNQALLPLGLRVRHPQGQRARDIKSLADPRLKKLKIGVNIFNSDAENTPPAMALSRYGVVGNLTGYPTFYTDTVRPEDIINAVAKKDIDVGIVWGPWPATSSSSRRSRWTLQPLRRAGLADRLPFSVQHRHGVRRRDKELRDSLQTVLDRRRPEIQAILKEYGVPTFPIASRDSRWDEAKPPKSTPQRQPTRRGLPIA